MSQPVFSQWLKILIDDAVTVSCHRLMILYQLLMVLKILIVNSQQKLTIN